MNSNTTDDFVNIEVCGVKLYAGYEFVQGNCSICRNSLCAPPHFSHEVNKGKTVNETNVQVLTALGACNHMFHKACIETLKRGNNASCISCVICGMLWKEVSTQSCDITVSRDRIEKNDAEKNDAGVSKEKNVKKTSSK